jgi:hypothetical protein
LRHGHQSDDTEGECCGADCDEEGFHVAFTGSLTGRIAAKTNPKSGVRIRANRNHPNPERFLRMLANIPAAIESANQYKMTIISIVCPRG